MSRISRTIAIAAIAIAGFPASAMAADEAEQNAAAMPPLKPSITWLRGPYAGIIGGGDSVAIGQRDGVTDLRNSNVFSLAGTVAGYQWRAGMGPRQAFWGVETDIVSLDLLQGGQPGGADWLATVPRPLRNQSRWRPVGLWHSRSCRLRRPPGIHAHRTGAHGWSRNRNCRCKPHPDPPGVSVFT